MLDKLNNNKEGFLIKQNPDEETYKGITRAVIENDNYCCCSIDKTPDTVCMCKDFRDNEDSGFCHCGRFYKVKKYPIITIIHAPYDVNHALDLANYFTSEGFIVLLPMYEDALQYMRHQNTYQNLLKAKIHQADFVFVINSCKEAMDFLEEEIYWAEDLKKKIVYEHKEEVKDDETGEH